MSLLTRFWCKMYNFASTTFNCCKQLQLLCVLTLFTRFAQPYLALLFAECRSKKVRCYTLTNCESLFIVVHKPLFMDHRRGRCRLALQKDIDVGTVDSRSVCAALNPSKL
jgi:hypothetical protein